jgi:hypothetical protein
MTFFIKGNVDANTDAGFFNKGLTFLFKPDLNTAQGIVYDPA